MTIKELIVEAEGRIVRSELLGWLLHVTFRENSGNKVYHQCVFTVCSLCVHCAFTVCSLCVHCVFTVCSMFDMIVRLLGRHYFS